MPDVISLCCSIKFPIFQPIELCIFLLILLLPIPPLGVCGQVCVGNPQVSGCMALNCQMGLNHNTLV